MGAILVLVVGLTLGQLARTQLAASAGSLELRPDPPTLCSRDFGEKLVVAAAWEGAEAKNFEKVLDRFRKRFKADIVYATGTNDIATKLRASIAAGCPPQVALLPQPGLLEELARNNALVPLEEVVGAEVNKNYARMWRQLGTVDTDLYGVWFKAANKSVIWYNTELFEAGGVEPPRTWEELKKVAGTLVAKGIVPFSVAGADGWTLTDWFENVYLRTAGPEMYDRLQTHQIPWTHPTVLDALSTLREVFGNDSWLLDGQAGALQTTFPASVGNVFGASPRAAMVFGADFLYNFIPDHGLARVGQDARFFEFPSIGGSSGLVWSAAGGDVAVLLKDDDDGRDLVRFLATPAAAEPWVRAGGFISPNEGVSLSWYKDDAFRNLARTLRQTETSRFDLSDQQPTAFGSTPGAGMPASMQNFLRGESNQRVANEMEAARAKL